MGNPANSARKSKRKKGIFGAVSNTTNTATDDQVNQIEKPGEVDTLKSRKIKKQRTSMDSSSIEDTDN